MVSCTYVLQPHYASLSLILQEWSTQHPESDAKVSDLKKKLWPSHTAAPPADPPTHPAASLTEGRSGLKKLLSSLETLQRGARRPSRATATEESVATATEGSEARGPTDEREETEEKAARVSGKVTQAASSTNLPWPFEQPDGLPRGLEMGPPMQDGEYRGPAGKNGGHTRSGTGSRLPAGNTHNTHTHTHMHKCTCMY